MSRLGLYIDGPFRRSGEGEPRQVLAGEELFGFLRFACAVGAHFEEFHLIGREVSDPTAASQPLPGAVALDPLPDYGSLRNLGSLLRSGPATVRGLWRAIAEVDVLWVTGVHPFGLLAALLGRLRGRRVVLLIRQETMPYFRSRLPGPRWVPLLAPLWILESAYRLLARRLPVTAVGPRIAARYGAPGPHVLEIRVSSLAAGELPRAPSARPPGLPVRLLSVGRIDREKDPLLAVSMLAELERRAPGAHQLTWVGDGPMAGEMRIAAKRAGVSERLHLPGYAAPGPELARHYAAADVFVLCSLTEGVPAVILEAQAAGLPIVATEVGGVSVALDGGAAGVLVPGRSAVALATAVKGIETDRALRDRLVRRGRVLVAGSGLEAEAQRAATFIYG